MADEVIEQCTTRTLAGNGPRPACILKMRQALGPFQRTRLRLSASLRGKTLFIILAVILGLVGGLYLLARVVLLRGFAKIEEEYARQNLDRAASALSNELATLDRTATDYSSWDHTYSYLLGKNPRFPESDLPSITLSQLRLNFVVILDKSGKKVFSRGMNLVTLEEAPLPYGLESQLSSGSPFVARTGEARKKLGILMLASGPALVDFRPVLTSESEGPAVGTLIMGRMLDSDELLRLGEMTHMAVGLGRLDTGDLPPDFRLAAAEIQSHGPVSVRPLITNRWRPTSR